MCVLWERGQRTVVLPHPRIPRQEATIAAGIVPRPQIRQPARGHLRARKREGTGPTPRARQRFSVWLIGFGKRDRAAGVGQLAHGAEGISEEVISGCVHLCDSTKSVWRIRGLENWERETRD